MERKIKEIIVMDHLDWGYGVTIKQLEENIANLKELGATDIYIETDECFGNCSLTIKAVYYREETDEEYQARIDEENRLKKQKFKHFNY